MKPIDRTEAERLVQTYSDMILRLSYTYLKSTQDAEDICQTVFLKLLTGGMVFDSPEHEKAWVLRTAANACKDALRAAHRRCVGLEAVAEAAAPEPPDSAVLDAVMALPEKIPRSSVPVLLRRLFRARGRRPARQERGRGLRPSQPRPEKACGKHLEASFMNREYNDNREYKNALDELHFSEEAKNRMVERLMERAEQPAPRRVRRFPRIAAVGVAAALVLSIGAGASGVLKSASEVFAGVFGPTADTEIIDQIGRPIGASDTSNGVTVTADAILFDGYNYLISYTLKRTTAARSTARKIRIPACTTWVGSVRTAPSDAAWTVRAAAATSTTKTRAITRFSMWKPCRTTTPCRPAARSRSRSAI